MGTHPIFESDFDCLTDMARALSFSGCGFNGAYHIGVQKAVAQRLDMASLKFSGASAGSIAATNAAIWAGKNESGDIALIHDIRLCAKKHMFTNRMVPELTSLLDRFYPDDLVDCMNDRVFISLTNVDKKLKMHNTLKSKFASRQEALDTIVASCLVPGWAGYRAIVIDGQKYVDGGFTTNLPDLIPGETIRVQPFSTSAKFAEVSPVYSHPEDCDKRLLQHIDRNNTFTMYLTRLNLNRAVVKALLPPDDDQWYIDMLQEGFDNTNAYFDTCK